MGKKIKRPKFYDYVGMPRHTDRVCPSEGCDRPARLVNGYYLVDRRRVRVWSCARHYLGNPLRVLPTPPSIVAALEAEKRHYENMAKRYRYDVSPDKGVSVKTLASSGHGPQIPYDRAQSFRWGV